jgi:phage major head subunit gpT-like protein
MGATMIDRAKIEAAFVVFSTVFDMKLKNTPVIYPQIATVIPGVSERVEFKWLSSIPVMRKWVGDRTLQRLRGETQALTTDWWANGIEVDVDDLNNEAKLGMIAARIRSMAQACARRMDDQVVQFYINGFAGTLGVTYDNQFLYDTDHTAAGNGSARSRTTSSPAASRARTSTRAAEGDAVRRRRGRADRRQHPPDRSPGRSSS